MAQKSKSGKPVTYLRINKDGILYTQTTKDAEDAVEVVSKDGEVYYHELFNRGTDPGKMTLQINKKEFGVFLNVYIDSTISDNVDCIQLPMWTSRGGLDSYVKNLIMYLPNIAEDDIISIRPSTETYKNKKGQEKISRSFFIKNESESTYDKPLYYKTALKVKTDENPNGEVPKVNFKERPDGALTVDSEEQDKYLYGILEEHIGRFTRSENRGNAVKEDTTEEKQTEKTEKPKSTETSEQNKEGFDDLPF